MKATTRLLLVAPVALLLPLAAAAVPSKMPGGVDSGHIEPDASWSHVFSSPGMFYYHCEPHPFMEGTIEVTENAENASTTAEIVGYKFVPKALVIAPGTNVTFHNQDDEAHTVTQNEAPAKGKSPAPTMLLVLASVALVAFAMARSRRE